jgi:hypothetical protein
VGDVGLHGHFHDGLGAVPSVVAVDHFLRRHVDGEHGVGVGVGHLQDHAGGGELLAEVRIGQCLLEDATDVLLDLGLVLEDSHVSLLVLVNRG